MLRAKRQSIREAPKPGAQIKTRSLPEQPIGPSGEPADVPPKYEELAEYAAVARTKLDAFRELVETVYVTLDALGKDPSVEDLEDAVSSAKDLLDKFDRKLPVLGKLREAAKKGKKKP
jgi:hypothetical protein